MAFGSGPRYGDLRLLAQHPEDAAVFDVAMTSISTSETASLPRSCPPHRAFKNAVRCAGNSGRCRRSRRCRTVLGCAVLTTWIARSANRSARASTRSQARSGFDRPPDRQGGQHRRRDWSGHKRQCHDDRRDHPVIVISHLEPSGRRAVVKPADSVHFLSAVVLTMRQSPPSWIASPGSMRYELRPSSPLSPR